MFDTSKEAITIFQKNLKMARIICGLTTYELADMIKVTHCTLSRYEDPEATILMPCTSYIAVRYVLEDYVEHNLAYPITDTKKALSLLFGPDEKARKKVIDIVCSENAYCRGGFRGMAGRFDNRKRLGERIRARFASELESEL